MTDFVESYLLNSSQLQSTTVNNQTIVPDIPLTSISRTLLTVRGIVYTLESQGTVEISGATVVIYNSIGEPVGQATTDSNGTYTITFDGELNVNYNVTASAEGYQSVTDISMFTNNTNIVDIFFLPTSTTLLTIYGRILSSTGEGLANASVAISGGGNLVNITTAADGTFLAYDNFQTGVNYTITANQLGFNTATQTVQIDTGSIGKYVILTLNQTSTNLTSITGRVIIEGSSNPTVGLANALVGLYIVDDAANPAKQLIATVLSSEYGYYTFNNVDPGQNYIIKAIKIVSV